VSGRSPITTHVLDLGTGRPAAGVDVVLEAEQGGSWVRLAHGTTNSDGRIEGLLEPGSRVATGRYRLDFATGAYFATRGEACFYPLVAITFEVTDVGAHHHVPLLLSPFGYSTYRGS
jgi:5-hydroxyisourate hydrolase